MHSRRKIQILVITVLFNLAACEKNVMGSAKSLEYYGEHLSEADSVIAKCHDQEQKELSVMSPTQRLAWMDTADGINCRNASQARSSHNYAERQRQMREAADKYK